MCWFSTWACKQLAYLMSDIQKRTKIDLRMSRHHRYLYVIWSRLTRDVEISDRICENLMAVEVKSYNVSSLDLECLSYIPIVVKIFPSDYRRSCSKSQAVAKVGRVHPLKDVNLKNVLQSYSCQDISVRTSRQLRFPRLPKSHNELLSEILALEVDVFNNIQQTIGAHWMNSERPAGVKWDQSRTLQSVLIYYD